VAFDPRVRRAEPDDAPEVARLLHRFSTEYKEPIDQPEVLERRYREQLPGDDFIVILVREGEIGFAQLRYRSLLEAALEEARARGADHFDLTTSVDDTAARGLYDSAGFTNREGKPDGPVMLYYERNL
jgi:GNAT superfamily N-acetyltransferase